MQPINPPNQLGAYESACGEGSTAYIFTKNQVQDIVSFLSVLERIHRRLIANGYTIRNGEIIPPIAQT